MFSTRVIVLMIISALLGLFHFGVSRIIKLETAKTDKDRLQVMIIRMWGKRGLIFSFIMIPVYFLRDDIFLFVVLIYLGLLGYNSFLLRKGITKLNEVYATKENGSK
jgi:hypothetical protein